MKTNYSWAERKERSILYYVMERVLKPDSYYFSKINSKEVWDFILHYKKSSYLGDIKVLNTASDKYDCLLLEDKKVRNMLYSTYKLGISSTMLYISHYNDHQLDILKIDADLVNKYKPQWINVSGKNKLVYFIPKFEATRFNLGKLMMDYIEQFKS